MSQQVLKSLDVSQLKILKMQDSYKKLTESNEKQLIELKYQRLYIELLVEYKNLEQKYSKQQSQIADLEEQNAQLSYMLDVPVRRQASLEQKQIKSQSLKFTKAKEQIADEDNELTDPKVLEQELEKSQVQMMDKMNEQKIALNELQNIIEEKEVKTNEHISIIADSKINDLKILNQELANVNLVLENKVQQLQYETTQTLQLPSVPISNTDDLIGSVRADTQEHDDENQKKPKSIKKQFSEVDIGKDE